MSNFRYRLRETVRILAVGENDVKNRLELACSKHLFMATPFFEPDLPDYFKFKYDKIIESLTQKEWGVLEIKGDRLRATLHRMHKKTASNIALDILVLYIEYEEYVHGNFLQEKSS
ncbi:MAG: hypothetical protein U5S82_19985 [Gammaproteobacteria bacterium]|nr:hypothetical protein [Gammaproteobacteria bacterium]